MEQNQEKLNNLDQAVVIQYLEEQYKRPADGQFVLAIGAPITGASIDRILYYKENSEQPHWDFVSFGLSDTEGSNLDFELTLRIPQVKGEEKPHEWPMRLFSRIGEYSQGEIPLRMYDYLELGNIDADVENSYTGALLIPDQKLLGVTVNDRQVVFMQIVPLLSDELEYIKQLAENVQDESSSNLYEDKVKEFISSLQEKTASPLIVTNFIRSSVYEK